MIEPPGPDEYHWRDEYHWSPRLPDPRIEYLPTLPGTYLEFSPARPRRRPCWRCRLWLRWPPWRRHWGCRKLPRLIYLESKPRRAPE